ncbi:NF038104 family lipoprotein [Planctobacterium marinum]|uniref:NF038104 family lipoprotein n=1 Tax=Planctobacterium marinum TaxID=1631968 RepID=UPI001E3C83CF|nr:NF038104 family lipoprotein [Planctobacterium marinum]MCC2605438.1 NF038104 family lipoprotein [Planctobacterium marinum]
MKKQLLTLLSCLLLLNLSGCVAVAVVDAAVGVTTTVVEGTVDVVDAVTPDVFSDDEDDNEDEDEDEDE